jgi:ATP-binding cassette subfamily F protein 3
VIAHVAQETPALPTPALEFVLDGDAELRQIEHDLQASEAPTMVRSPGGTARPL